MELKISRAQALPTKAVTSKLAFIGQSGSGKTYAAGKFAEECLAVGAQTIIIDNVGIWWGLRLAANSTSPGISIPVFGGEHADVPLDPNSGSFMAKLIAEKKFSCVLDVSDFTEGEKHRWTADFAKEFLFQKKRHKSAVMMIWEECHEFVPEFSRADTAAMLGAMQRLIKKGRNYGIGHALISQQPQAVSKSVLNQTEILFVFKANGKHERKAIGDWVVYNHVEDAVEDAVASLPELEPGECFVWSPTMLKVFKRIKISKKWTYDASATPEFDEGEIETGRLAKVDLDRLSAEMRAMVEKAKEEDPGYLRARIAELEKELAMARKQGGGKSKTVPVLSERDFKRLEKLLTPLASQLRDFEKRLEKVDPTKQYQAPVQDQPVRPMRQVLEFQGERHELLRPPPPVVNVQRLKPTKVTNGESKVTGRAIEMLRVLSFYPQGLERTELAVRAVILQSGTFSTYLGNLRSAGYIEDGRGVLLISEAGRQALRKYFPNGVGHKPTYQELVEQWKQEYFTGKEKDLVDIIVSQGGNVIERGALAEAAKMEESGTFSTYLGRIRSAGIIEKGRHIRASQALLSA